MDHAAIIKAGVSKRASKIQDALNGWIDEHVGPADDAALGIALLRIAAQDLRSRHDKADVLEMMAHIIDEMEPRYTPEEIRAILDAGSR